MHEPENLKRVAASETPQVVDTAIRLHGAQGHSKDTRPKWMCRYARQPRLVDGPSAAHKVVVARTLLETRSEMGTWKTQPAEHIASKE